LGNVAHGKPAAHVVLDDGFRHEQADPRSNLWPLGGKVGIEDLVYDLFRNSSSVVGYRYDSMFVFTG
jgi:hypothetical protein